MEKFSQLPKTEGCSAEGEPVDLLYFRLKRPSRSVSRDKREPQAGPASCLSNRASKELNASGDGVSFTGTQHRDTREGEGVEGWRGLEGVAGAEADARNRGNRGSPGATNYRGQPGGRAQRQK